MFKAQHTGSNKTSVLWNNFCCKARVEELLVHLSKLPPSLNRNYKTKFQMLLLFNFRHSPFNKLFWNFWHFIATFCKIGRHFLNRKFKWVISLNCSSVKIPFWRPLTLLSSGVIPRRKLRPYWHNLSHDLRQYDGNGVNYAQKIYEIGHRPHFSYFTDQISSFSQHYFDKLTSWRNDNGMGSSIGSWFIQQSGRRHLNLDDFLLRVALSVFSLNSSSDDDASWRSRWRTWRTFGVS